ncbi:MAG: nicotinate (nicotinamide) nucleotide adenylyltransferase [Sphaerospermopsis sp. SIO1G2]|nr:nicotinate (nicotinamide) nucleotide adenylyltransferase [Sphaerospermopsis sp. SIO1G2]
MYPGLRASRPRVIGILGGSFNPAHAGHIHITKAAMRALGLDAVVWLVSPSNPLKDPASLAPFAMRVHHARHLTRHHPSLHVSALEQQQHLTYTVDTLSYITRTYRQHRFIWLMGADNLASFHRWRNWQQIASLVPIAIMDRAPRTRASLSSPFVRRFHAQRVPPRQLAASKAPAWSFLFIKRHAESATRLRNSLGTAAFLGHNGEM